MSAEITLISKAGNGSMSKVIDLDEHGALRSDGSACFLVEGTADRRPAATAAELADIIASCGSNQALALGSLKEGISAPARVVTKQNLHLNLGAISRSREYIDYQPNRPAWGLVDFDTKGMPPEVRARIDAAGDVWRALLEVAPDLARAARVSRGSTSSGLVDTSTDEPVAGSTGQHHYLLVRDGADIERFLKDLHDRAWLNGFGWHLIGATGQLLDRSIVDRFVGYGERLVFEGQPQVLPPLLQDPAKRRPEAIEGEAIDFTSVVPPLNELERHRVGELKAASAAALGKVATEVRTKHDKVLADKLVKSGVPLVRAQRLVATRHHGVLSPCIELEFDDLGIKTVGDVLADPDRFVGETLADPLEGVAYGRCIAMVMQRDEGTLFIHSFAHGRSFYELRHDIQSAKAALTGAPAGAVVDHAMSVLAAAALEADEVADFAAGSPKPQTSRSQP